MYLKESYRNLLVEGVKLLKFKWVKITYIYVYKSVEFAKKIYANLRHLLIIFLEDKQKGYRHDYHFKG